MVSRESRDASATHGRIVPSYVTRYARDRLARLLGQGEVVEIRAPEHGKKSEIFLISFSTGKRVALRVFRERPRFERYRRVMEFQGDKALPLARIVVCDGGLLTRVRFRCFFVIEDFVEGRHVADVADVTAAHAEPVLQALASLHNHTSPGWGNFGRLRKPSAYKAHVLESMRETVRDVAARSSGLSASEASVWERWFAAHVEAMPNPRRFSLVHQHLGPDDIILSPDGSRATFLDNGNLRFGCFVQDVEQILTALGGEDPAKRRRVLARYMQLQTHLPREADYERDFRAFRARYHLLRLRSLLNRRPRSGAVGEDAVRATLRALRAFVVDGGFAGSGPLPMGRESRGKQVN